jgi:hypothetical protein
MRSRLLAVALVVSSSGLWSCAPEFHGTEVAVPDDCVPLDLFSYEFENSCVTSGGDKDECDHADATHSYTTVDTAARSITATAISQPPGYFGTAYRIFTVPNGPHRVSIQGALTGLESRSAAKMQVRAGCFFEWSGNDMYNTLIPYVSREGRFAIKYSRNGIAPGDGVESLGLAVPAGQLALQLQLSVDASVKFSAAAGIVRGPSGPPYLNKSWTGQPAIVSGVAESFDPSKFRIFCGATVEDGDGTPMSVAVTLSGIQGSVCYPHAPAAAP